MALPGNGPGPPEAAPQAQLPTGWSPSAHVQWLAGQRLDAIESVLAELRAQQAASPAHTPAHMPAAKPSVALLLQVAYYIFLVDDPLGAARFLDMAREQEPHNPEILRNLGVCLSRGGQLEASVAVMRELSHLCPSDAVCWDSLCSSLATLGDLQGAQQAGRRAIELKDQPQASSLDSSLDSALNPAHGAAPRWAKGWAGLPATGPRLWLRQRGPLPSVLSFSLWGHQPRYLRGALDNTLAAAQVYPGWTLRFYVDDSVPAELCSALQDLGAQVRYQPPGQSLRQRLAWRFDVANDPSVGRFVVRDVDSVVLQREAAAVDDWIASDQWFHVMRDWWTHTDPMLAGLWGGVAGVLPALMPLLQAYRPPAMETPNIDQWFLRDQVWPLIRGHCRVHDRCFAATGGVAWPTATPPAPQHVGQDVYSADRAGQAQRLGPWLGRLACLGELSRPVKPN